MKNSLRHFSSLAVAALAVGWCTAPQLEAAGGSPVFVPVRIMAHAEVVSPDPWSWWWEVYLDGTFLPSSPGATDGYASDYANGDTESAGVDLDLGTVRFEPGVTYWVSVTGSGMQPWMATADVYVAAPPGYYVEIDGVERNSIFFFMENWVAVRVLRRSDGGGASLAPAGTATSFGTSKIDWRVSLGGLKDGSSAGEIMLSDSGYATGWSAQFTRAHLYYEPTSSEIFVHRDGTGLRQIVANEAVVDLVTLSGTSYEIRFYNPTQLAGSGGYPRTITGDPYVKFKVEQTGGTTALKITRDTRNVVSSSSSSAVHTDLTTLTRTGSAPTYDWTVSDWTLSGQSALVERLEDGGTTGGGARKATKIVKVPGGAIALESTRVFAALGWGDVVATDTAGTSNSVTSTFDYYTNSSEWGSYGQVKSETRTGGQWIGYEYFPVNTLGNAAWIGLVKRTYRPFGDSPGSVTFNTAQGEVTEYGYAADPLGMITRPTLIETKINNVTTAKTTIGYSNLGAVNSLQVVQATRKDYSDATYYLETVRKYYREDVADKFFRGQIHSVQAADGVKKSYVYQRGSWNGSAFSLSGNNGLDPGAGSRICVITGNTTTGSSYTSHDGYDLDDLYLVDGKSTLEVAIRDERALLRRTETYVRSSGSWVKLAWLDYTYDFVGRLTGTTSGTGALTSTAWDGLFITSTTDENGFTTSFTYDYAGRTSTVTSAAATGGAGVPSLTTTFGYNALGQKTSVSRGPSTAIVESWTYDDAGRLSSHSVPGQSGAVTMTYSYANGGRDVTETDPYSQTKITSAYLDGRPKSVTGTAVVSSYVQYTVNGGNGTIETRTQLDSGGSDGAGWRKVTTDWLGRAILTLSPTTNVSVQAGVSSSYDTTTGRLNHTVPVNGSLTPIAAPTRFEYDVLGAVVRSGLDVNSNGSLSTASDDRITDIAYGVVYADSAWWFQRQTSIYPTSGNGTALLIEDARTRATDFASGTIAEAKVQDRFGNWTRTWVEVDRNNAIRYERATIPGSSTDAETELRGGLPVRQRTKENVTTLIAYDDWRRLLQQRQATSWPSTPGAAPNSGHATALLAHFTYHAGTDLVHTKGNWAKWAFDTAVYTYDGLNRVIGQTDAEGGTRYFAYTEQRQLQYQWGSAQQPVRYDYDSYGRRHRMHTYRGGSGWTGGSVPGGFSSDGEKTTWAFHDPTGLVTSKTDALNEQVTFTYTARNELDVRTLARGVTADHAYDSATGELTGIDYSGSTPDVTYTYQRDGQLATVADGTGTRTFGYGSYRELREEELASAFYGSRAIERWYFYSTSGGAAIGTLNATAFGADGNVWTGGGGSLNQTNYGYDWSKGRLNDVNRLYESSTTRTFTYAYESNGHRIASITGNSGTWTRTNYLQSWRPITDGVVTSWNGSDVATHWSNYDWLARRDDETLTGSLATALGITAPVLQEWTYNARSEVTAETVKYNGSAQSGLARAYAWDNSWNRDTATTGGNTTTYNYASPSANQIDSTTGHEAEGLTYDDDGNLTQDGTWDYTYDAENRLVRMERHTGSAACMRLDFEYDYLGRRVRKTTYTSTAGTTEIDDLKYVYDGWNLWAELDANNSNAALRTYTWGPDAAGMIGGAGAAGLLMISSGSDRWFPAYDGRHNVTGLLDQNGTWVAAYTYDTFGRLTIKAGNGSGAAEEDLNPFGYSTQYTDRETGLVYYGKRFYSPKLGRFINRDPIEEAGGLNLYAFCGNGPSFSWDALGLTQIWGFLRSRNGGIGYFAGDPDPSWTQSADGGHWTAPNGATYYRGEVPDYGWEPIESDGDQIFNPELIQAQFDQARDAHFGAVNWAHGLADWANGMALWGDIILEVERQEKAAAAANAALEKQTTENSPDSSSSETEKKYEAYYLHNSDSAVRIGGVPLITHGHSAVLLYDPKAGAWKFINLTKDEGETGAKSGYRLITFSEASSNPVFRSSDTIKDGNQIVQKIWRFDLAIRRDKTAGEIESILASVDELTRAFESGETNYGFAGTTTRPNCTSISANLMGLRVNTYATTPAIRHGPHNRGATSETQLWNTPQEILRLNGGAEPFGEADPFWQPPSK